MEQLFIKLLKTNILLLFFLISVDCSAQENTDFIRKSGDFFQIALPASAIISTYFYQDSDQPHWQFVKSFASALIITHSLKRIIQKPRPDNSDKFSFPSGHTTAAFSGASFLQLRYGWKIGVPAYLLAAWVGYSRIYANRHDFWDVLGGASIGVGTALLFVKKYKNNKTTFSIDKLDDFYLITLNYNF